MSWQATAWAKEQRTGSPSLKATLLCLADYAHPETAECFPSQAALAADVEVSVRTIRTNLVELERLKLIERSHRESRLGRQTDVYKLPICPQSHAANLASGEPSGKAQRQIVAAQETTLLEQSPTVEDKGLALRSKAGSPYPQPSGSARAKVRTEGAGPELNLAGEPEAKPKPAKRSKARTAVNPDWTPDQAGFSYAREAGMSEIVVQQESSKFRNYHASKGNLMADWNAAWRTWCDNHKSFVASRPVFRSSAPAANGFRQRTEPRPGDVDYRDPNFRQYVP